MAPVTGRMATLPDTLFRSLLLLAGMTTCGCYSQPEDTEMITSVVGSTNRTSSDLRYSVAMGEDRTWHRAIRSRLTRMYGPAVRCKRFSSRWHSAVLHQYPVSDWSWSAPDHHGYQCACVLVSGQASTGQLGHQFSHAPGRRHSPSPRLLA